MLESYGIFPSYPHHITICSGSPSGFLPRLRVLAPARRLGHLFVGALQGDRGEVPPEVELWVLSTWRSTGFNGIFSGFLKGCWWDFMGFNGFSWVFRAFNQPIWHSMDWVSGKIYGKPWFLPSLKRVSCKFPLQPIAGNGEIVENHETSATIMHQLTERERESHAAFDLGDLCISIICIIIYIIQ